MFFRFGSALLLVVVISLLGIFIEKQNLTMRRELSRQHYRMDVLQDRHARLRLRSQQLAAIERLFETVEDENSGLVPAEPAAKTRYQPESVWPDVTDVHIESPLRNSRTGGNESGASQTVKRRVPLLFWQQPLRDPRLERSRP